MQLDDLDIKLLRACEANSGKPLTEICDQFLEDRNLRALYYRMAALERAGLIKIDRSAVRGRSLCYIEESGKTAIAGRKNIPPKSEESS
jgi:hypothetical protein